MKAKEGLNLKWRRQKMKSIYFANNQWLWIKINFDSQKIKKIFMTFLKKGVGVEIKCHITYFREQIELWVASKKEVEKPWVGPNTGYFSSWWPLLGARKLAHKKFKKQFFPNICYIL